MSQLAPRSPPASIAQLPLDCYLAVPINPEIAVAAAEQGMGAVRQHDLQTPGAGREGELPPNPVSLPFLG